MCAAAAPGARVAAAALFHEIDGPLRQLRRDERQQRELRLQGQGIELQRAGEIAHCRGVAAGIFRILIASRRPAFGFDAERPDGSSPACGGGTIELIENLPSGCFPILRGGYSPLLRKGRQRGQAKPIERRKRGAGGLHPRGRSWRSPSLPPTASGSGRSRQRPAASPAPPRPASCTPPAMPIVPANALPRRGPRHHFP
jgi:hypothetical protein